MGGVLVAAAIGSTAVATAASPDLRTGLVAKAPSIVTSTTQGPATTPDPAPSSSAAVPTTEAAPPAALTMAGQAAP
ncbi:MAG: serine/threonine protein kinase, partial [Ilumatobacteraceae bacterium]